MTDVVEVFVSGCQDGAVRCGVLLWSIEWDDGAVTPTDAFAE